MGGRSRKLQTCLMIHRPDADKASASLVAEGYSGLGWGGMEKTLKQILEAKQRLTTTCRRHGAPTPHKHFRFPSSILSYWPLPTCYAVRGLAAAVHKRWSLRARASVGGSSVGGCMCRSERITSPTYCGEDPPAEGDTCARRCGQMITIWPQVVLCMLPFSLLAGGGRELVER